jgi:hypothetical protein
MTSPATPTQFGAFKPQAYSDDRYRRKQSSGEPSPSPSVMQAARQLFET